MEYEHWLQKILYEFWADAYRMGYDDGRYRKEESSVLNRLGSAGLIYAIFDYGYDQGYQDGAEDSNNLVDCLEMVGEVCPEGMELVKMMAKEYLNKK